LELRDIGPIGASAYFHVPFGLQDHALPSCVTPYLRQRAVGTEARATRAWPHFARSMGVLLSERRAPETETLGEERSMFWRRSLGDVGWKLLEEFLASPAMPTTCSQRDVMYVSLPSMKRSAWRTRSARTGGVEGAPGPRPVAERTDPPTGSLLVHERAHGLRPRGHACVRPDDPRPRLDGEELDERRRRRVRVQVQVPLRAISVMRAARACGCPCVECELADPRCTPWPADARGTRRWRIFPHVLMSSRVRYGRRDGK